MHYLYRRCCSLFQSPQASSLYTTRVVLALIPSFNGVAACALVARLEPLLDPRAPGTHYLYRQCCHLFTLCMPRVFTRPVCSWRALHVSPMLQLVQSPHASSLYSTRLVLAHTTCAIDVAACALFADLKPLFDPDSLAGTNCPTDATACAVSERPGPLLDLGFPCRYKLSRQYYILCSLQTPRVFTQPRLPGRHELPHCSLCGDASTHDVPSSTVL